jgi:hypothetical protein
VARKFLKMPSCIISFLKKLLHITNTSQARGAHFLNNAFELFQF